MSIKAVLLACGGLVLSIVVSQSGYCASPSPQLQSPAIGKEKAGTEASPPSPESKRTIVDSPFGNEPWNLSESPLRWRELGKDFVQDQKQIWTSPLRLRFSDTEWLVPLAGISAGFMVTDRDVSPHLSHDPKTISHYNALSNAGVGALVGGTAGLWLLSYPSHNAHWRETGVLAGQAALNSLLTVEAFKYAFGRERPLQGTGAGHFFQGGTSFPSEHAAAAWAVAGVIGHEYPGPLPRLLAYGLAAAVSYSRVRAEQHFPSDVFIGGTLGSLVAQQVYSHHHDPELGGSAWRSVSDFFHSEGAPSPENQGSPYVPLDSWVYPALDRLAGFGLVQSGFAGMRPWTRRECIRLLNEAEENLSEKGSENEDAQELIAGLERQFRPEMDAAEAGADGGF
ncbi:MAG: phosphatase PAP2 family protein, partial [Terriglobales bacterium]